MQRREHNKKAAFFKSRGKATKEIKPADTWLLDFYPPELSESPFTLFKPLHLWYLVMVVLLLLLLLSRFSGVRLCVTP